LTPLTVAEQPKNIKAKKKENKYLTVYFLSWFTMPSISSEVKIAFEFAS
jgi:hypothetical protein